MREQRRVNLRELQLPLWQLAQHFFHDRWRDGRRAAVYKIYNLGHAVSLARLFQYAKGKLPAFPARFPCEIHRAVTRTPSFLRVRTASPDEKIASVNCLLFCQNARCSLTPMRHFASTIFLAAALLFGSALVTSAQTYDLSWHVIAGGGGTSTGTNASSVVYSVSGTIGQSDAGTMSGAPYSLTGGFWGIIATVQTLGAPLLTISAAGANHVVLAWAASATGYVLQQDATLGNTNWLAVNTNTFPIVPVGGSNTVTLPVSGNQYFRLSHP
jgi:hypothetical protein